jgi:acetamidase/formamidase
MNGAEAGDVLEVRIKEITPRSLGLNLIFPGTGTLREDFRECCIKEFYSDWANKETSFPPGMVLPLRPWQEHG